MLKTSGMLRILQNLAESGERLNVPSSAVEAEGSEVLKFRRSLIRATWLCELVVL